MATKYPMVLVEWHDPSFERGPFTEQDEKDRRPIRVQDLGFLIHRDKDEVHIASALYPDEDEGILNATVIPQTLIDNVVILGGGGHD